MNVYFTVATFLFLFADGHMFMPIDQSIEIASLDLASQINIQA